MSKTRGKIYENREWIFHEKLLQHKKLKNRANR